MHNAALKTIFHEWKHKKRSSKNNYSIFGTHIKVSIFFFFSQWNNSFSFRDTTAPDTFAKSTLAVAKEKSILFISLLNVMLQTRQELSWVREKLNASDTFFLLYLSACFQKLFSGCHNLFYFFHFLYNPKAFHKVSSLFSLQNFDDASIQKKFWFYSRRFRASKFARKHGGNKMSKYMWSII